MSQQFLSFTFAQPVTDWLCSSQSTKRTRVTSLERESLAAMMAAITITLFLALVRILLRWYGEKHLGIHSVRISQRLRRAYQAFLSTSSS